MRCCTGVECKTCLRKNLLVILTFLGVVVGICLGFILRNAHDPWTRREIMYIGFVGKLFLAMLSCLIVPLIFSSIVIAIGAMNLQTSGRIGGFSMGYFLVTTFIAVVLGIILVLTIRPGEIGGDEGEAPEKVALEEGLTEDVFLDLIRNFFPKNPIAATLQRERTVLVNDSTNATTRTDMREFKITTVTDSGPNMIGVVFMSIVFGIAVLILGEKTTPLLVFFNAFNRVMMLLVTAVIWLSPLGVCSLIAEKVTEMKSFDVIAGKLGVYFCTVLLGIAIQGFVVLPLIFFLVTRTLPFRFMANMAPAMAMAFGTASSNATLPVTLMCLEERNHVDPRLTRFMVPIGVTINMNGTALYEGVAPIFIAQILHMSLNFGQLISISILATFAAVGAAGIPQAGLVTMLMVLTSIGLGGEEIGYIITVDWLLDRFRTMMNVYGDAMGAGTVAFLCRKELSTPYEEQPTSTEV